MSAVVAVIAIILVVRSVWLYIAVRRSQARDVAEWLARKGVSWETVSEAVERIGHLTVAEITTQRETYHYQRGYDAAMAEEHERRSQAARRGAMTRQGRP